MRIGDYIRRTRANLGLSQNELAEKSGISKSQISRIESGEQKNPGIETIVAIATALGVSLEELVYGEKSNDFSYIADMLEKMPEEDRKAVRKMVKGWILVSHSEQMK